MILLNPGGPGTSGVGEALGNATILQVSTCFFFLSYLPDPALFRW